jgi:hypothetical protein
MDCSITIDYDVMETTGPAELPQLYRVHLRTQTLPRRTPYELDCKGPLMLEIPADASGFRATSTSASEQVSLPVQASVISVPIGFGKRLRAEPRMQFPVVGWPRTLSRGDDRAPAQDDPDAPVLTLVGMAFFGGSSIAVSAKAEHAAAPSS